MKEQLLFLKKLTLEIKELNTKLGNLTDELEIKNRELEKIIIIKKDLKNLYSKKKKLKFGLLISIYNLIFLILNLALIITSHLIYLPLFASILITTALCIPLIFSIEGLIEFNPRKINTNIKKIEEEIKEKENSLEIKTLNQKIHVLKKEIKNKEQEISKIIQNNPKLTSIILKRYENYSEKEDLKKTKNLQKRKVKYDIYR